MALDPKHTQLFPRLNCDGTDDAQVVRNPPSSEEQVQLLSRVQAIIKDRGRRADHFSSELFGEPAWDILLELYAAELSQQRVPTSQITVQANIPATTVLRWLKVLDAAGYIVRKPDPSDARRVFLSLTPRGSDAMSSYFADGGA
jgi:DNA-binding MarR family transcriptional regulator